MSTTEGEGTADEQNRNSPDSTSHEGETLATDISAIRAILAAAAKHLAVDIPKEISPSAILNLDLLRPRAESYDAQHTIDYQIKQLPNNNLYQYHRPFDFPGPYNNSMTELGYTADGYICDLETNSKPTWFANTTFEEHMFIGGEPGDSDGPAWEEQRFGKDLIIQSSNFDGSALLKAGREGLSRAYFQLLGGIQNIPETMCRRDFRRSTCEDFIQQFLGKWTTHWRAVEYCLEEDIIFQYHVRTMSSSLVNPFMYESTTGKLPNRNLARGTLAIPNDKRQSLSIMESRHSICLKTTWKNDLSVFSMITLTKSMDLMPGLHDRGQWSNANIRPFNRSTGVAAFAFRIHSILPLWEEDWISLLVGIDDAVKTDLQSILDREQRRKLMYDGTGFQLSEFYFALIQILRIASDWIQESITDLRRLVDQMEELYYTPHDSFEATFLPDSPEAQALSIKVFKQNWESVISKQRLISEDLLTCISKKQEEVKSLRDALLSGTTINESTKSSQLNHYILVFTIVTIFYLPLSFVTET
ncbi:hypothetical protein F4677DRAFT_447842 [Hypoxylon crocopeplum]|nr:hypothetical protein F4677DRAFT_447842 [Hypoxylon crocopeplum]